MTYTEAAINSLKVIDVLVLIECIKKEQLYQTCFAVYITSQIFDIIIYTFKVLFCYLWNMQILHHAYLNTVETLRMYIAQ